MSLSKYEKSVISDLEGLDEPCSECPYFFSEQGWDVKVCHRNRCILDEEDET